MSLMNLLPPCRHRGPQRGDGNHPCGSSRLLAPNGVSPQFCVTECWCVNHESSGQRPVDDENAPCFHLGARLSRGRRQALGLAMSLCWSGCDHLEQPLGSHVCEAFGCGPKCHGYVSSHPPTTRLLHRVRLAEVGNMPRETASRPRWEVRTWTRSDLARMCIEDVPGWNDLPVTEQERLVLDRAIALYGGRECPASPEISVVVPTYDALKFLPQTLESLLAQTWKDFELIVVDDGSADRTWEFLQTIDDPRVRVMTKSNGGTGSALNAGFRESTGRYLTWWSADSFVEPEFLEDLRNALENNPPAVMAYSDFQIFDQRTLVVSETCRLPEFDRGRLELQNYVGPCWLWRREAAERVGTFSLGLNEDWDWHRRMAEIGSFVRVPKILGTWRYHDSSLTVSAVNNPGLWKLSRIPKVVHFYWGGRTLSFLRYMTVVSFLRLNPDWRVKIHMPKYLYDGTPTWPTHEHKITGQHVTGSDHTDDLRQLPVEFVEHDFESLGFRNDVPENFKGDFLRWHLLATEGGFSADIDIVFTEPMNSLPFNSPREYHSKIGLCPTKFGGIHAIGFIFSAPENPFFAHCRDECIRVFDPARYQSAGPFVLLPWPDVSMIERRWEMAVCRIPEDTVYLFDWLHMEDLFEKNASFRRPGTIGLHWFGGDPISQRWEQKLTRDNFSRFDSAICAALREVLS